MNRINHWNTGLLLVSILCFGSSLLLENVSFSNFAVSGRLSRFEETLQDKELHIYSFFDEIAGLVADSSVNDQIFSRLYQEHQPGRYNPGMELFLFHGDTLQYWTTNSVDIDPLFRPDIHERDVILCGNGWFMKKERMEGDWRIVGLILVKNRYSHENRFLQNGFHEDFRVPEETLVDTSCSIPGNIIHDSWNRDLFSLDFSQVSRYSPFQSGLSLVLFLIGIFLFLLYIRHLVKSIEHPPRRNTAIFLGVIILVLLNAILLKMPIPGHISILELFQPEQYAASDIFPTLADLLITTFFTFFLVYIFYAEFTMPGKLKTWFSRLWQTVYFAGILAYYLVIIALFKSLIVNSSISFEAYRVLELGAFTFVGLLILAFHYTALTILMDKYFSMFRSPAGIRGLVLHVTVAGTAILLAGFMLPWGPDPVHVLIIMLVMGMVFIIREHRPFRYSSFVLLIFLFSVLSVYQVVVCSGEKRQNEKMVLAVDLSAEHDPVAEFLLADLETRLAGDSELEYLIVDGFVDELIIDDYLLSNYFNGFWEKYDLQKLLCGPTDSLYMEPHDTVWYHCHDFFERLHTENGIRIPGSRFYFIDNMNGRISYFASFDYFSSDSSQTVTLFLELDSRLVTEELGYPELLLTDRLRKAFFERDYTSAKYSNGRLLTQSGDYSYSLSSNVYSNGNGEFESTASGGYEHLAYNMDPANTVVVSSARVGLLDILITFTYIFVFFYLLMTVGLLVVNIPFLERSLRLSIKNRIQYTMIGVLVLSLLLIGGGTIFFSIRQYRERQYASLSEKIQSVYIEVMHKLEFERTLTRDWQAAGYASLDELLKKFSNVFYTDINLYDPRGDLLATSRSEIFENSLLGPQIHPSAFREMAFLDAAEFVQQEQIGALSYLSAYVPFRNADNILLAYLNLPYFTRQESLTREISNLVVAVVNFYVLLITISVLIAVFLSAQITQPLRTIQEKFGKIALGKTNEKIEYEGRDEIGSLVVEYNHMVDELAGSAEKLARSERESAWREMAKQIAHEIKNPLTPMKLSVQHLQKTSAEGSGVEKGSLQRITRTLIDQIDHLSAIATEFSNFAQMPKTSNEKLDLHEKISKISELFLTSEQVRVETEFVHDVPPIIFADREQLSRVFINLIKNAIQSIPENREGKIGVRLETVQNNAVISIMDNGKGIPDELGDRLFQPNFTTKSSGMGMGLAIVKSIIENAGGDIRYETVLGEGTTFIIRLPLMDEPGNQKL